MILCYYGAKAFFEKNKIQEVDDFENLTIQEGGFFHSSIKSPTKGEVPFCVYLPNDWSSNDTSTYPLLIFLYGQGGDEYAFANDVAAKQLNNWIAQGEIEPLVILCFLGNPIPNNIQWFDFDNELFLTSDAEGELRDFCRKKFRAGVDKNKISLEGQSRGASGVLHFAFKYPNRFSSFIANAYVSDYTLENLKSYVKTNQSELLKKDFRLRIEIGDEDSFAKEYNRKGSALIHDFLTIQEIPHKFEIVENCDHWYRDFWEHQRKESNELNGLFHLKYHQAAWKKKVNKSNNPQN